MHTPHLPRSRAHRASFLIPADPIAELVRVVETIGSDHLGICLDPGNSVARLEVPQVIIDASAPHVVNLHVKDFAFNRAEGMIGFTFGGAELGTGLLDYDGMVATLEAHGRQVNHVVEHWLMRQESLEETCAMEREWVDAAVAWLQERGRA